MNLETKFENFILPAGYQAAGHACGIKPGGKMDLALITSDQPAAAAGVFTTNQVKAASVKLCMERIRDGQARAIVINSGCANACTGEQGAINAETMSTITADALGVDTGEVFVCSTGHIGPQLPMDKIAPGIRELAGLISAEGGKDAATGIMTTDTVPKTCTVEITIDGRAVRVSGLCKGAGMIHPNMATMLCFVLTDAAAESAALNLALKAAVDFSFNRVCVDGDTSTNDTLLLLANGAARTNSLNPDHPDWTLFLEAVQAVCLDLAKKIAQDGEGSTKAVTVRVIGAADDADADRAARTVANSIEVRANWFGDHVDWGRVMHALGYSKAKIVEDRVDIAYDGLFATKAGMCAGADPEKLSDVVRNPAFTMEINLNQGDGAAEIYSCDATEEYIRLNIH